MTNTSSACYHWEGEDLLIAVHMQPGASKDKIAGIVNDALKVSITASTDENEANNHLVRYLAKRFGVDMSSVVLIAGVNETNKRLRIQSPVKFPAGITPPS